MGREGGREGGRVGGREGGREERIFTHQSRLTDLCLHVFFLDSMFRFSFWLSRRANRDKLFFEFPYFSAWLKKKTIIATVGNYTHKHIYKQLYMLRENEEDPER